MIDRDALLGIVQPEPEREPDPVDQPWRAVPSPELAEVARLRADAAVAKAGGDAFRATVWSGVVSAVEKAKRGNR